MLVFYQSEKKNYKKCIKNFAKPKNISNLPKNISMSQSFAGKNLKYLRKQRGFTQEEFAVELGIKRSLLGAYEEERAEPRIEVLEKISDGFQVSLDALLRSDLSENSQTYLQKRQQQKLVSEHNLISFVPIKAAAGYLTGYAEDVFIDELNTFTLPMLGAGQFRAFEIVGDSMLPTPSGSIIVGEKVESVNDVKNNQTYVVVSRAEGIVFKRLIKNKSDKNQLTLVSDNPSFQPYQMNAVDMLELWQAQMVISKVTAQPAWDMSQLASLVSNLQEQVSVLNKRIN
jgi:transcriptional regulator with XRE-family HTH domain